MEAPGLYRLVPEMTSHHFCHNLFIRSELPGPGDTLREGTTRGMNIMRQRPSRAISEAAYGTEFGKILKVNIHGLVAEICVYTEIEVVYPSS